MKSNASEVVAFVAFVVFVPFIVPLTTASFAHVNPTPRPTPNPTPTEADTVTTERATIAGPNILLVESKVGRILVIPSFPNMYIGKETSI